jgi:hypothetical protein
MQNFKTFHGLDKNLPDVFFLHVHLFGLALRQPLVDIAVICELHHDAKED